MTRNDDPPTPTAPKKMNVAVLLIVASVFITVPVLVFAFVYLWLTASAFNTVEEVKADELDEVRIEMKNLPRGSQNRPDPLGDDKVRPDENTPFHTDPDIDPTRLMRPDFDVLLGTLRGAEPAEAKPPSPYLGKVEVRYKDGRRGTIMMYWAVEDDRKRDAPAVVWLRINGRYFKAGTLKELRTVAQACAERGEKVGR